MCVEFRIFGIPFVEVISDQKMNVSFETTLVAPFSTLRYLNWKNSGESLRDSEGGNYLRLVAQLSPLRYPN
jgi:hypothetical protein